MYSVARRAAIYFDIEGHAHRLLLFVLLLLPSSAPCCCCCSCEAQPLPAPTPTITLSCPILAVLIGLVPMLLRQLPPLLLVLLVLSHLVKELRGRACCPLTIQRCIHAILCLQQHTRATKNSTSDNQHTS
jgi:hypothetical protein